MAIHGKMATKQDQIMKKEVLARVVHEKKKGWCFCVSVVFCVSVFEWWCVRACVSTGPDR